MPRTRKPQPAIDLTDPQYFFNRELSWLAFNSRVLHEAMDTRTPLLERLKFMALFGSNLDEFFMVRVAGLKQQVAAGVTTRSPDGLTPQEQLAAIRDRLLQTIVQQQRYLQQALRPQLATQGIHLLNYEDLSEQQKGYLQQYFETRIFPVLTPTAVDPGHPFPYILNLRLNLAVTLKDPQTEELRFASVEVPKILPRFLPLPTQHAKGQSSAVWVGIPLEQAMLQYLPSLFPGVTVTESCLFRMTRNADLAVEEDEADDLLLAIEQELRKRRRSGSVVRLEIAASASAVIRETLVRAMQLAEQDVYEVEGLFGIRDLADFPDLPLAELRHPPWIPVTPTRLRGLNERRERIGSLQFDDRDDIFSILRQRDLLMHHPYQSFTASVQLFLTQAAFDPAVLAIKMTFYRTTIDFPILNALIAAAENGKQVAVLLELKARFDAASNVQWARTLERSGVHVVYGVAGLKTHAQVALVVRREAKGIRRYVHIGTGDYNPKVARQYTDVGLLSGRDELGADLTQLFNALTGYARQQTYRKLLVAPVNLRDRLLSLIQQEIDHCQQGQHGRIVAQMNALVDPEIITALYRASQAGVRIDLVVRGVCCLRPGVRGVSDNINVISIVGRFLEHARICYFHNAGKEVVLIGSADWMTRNLDRRVEVVVPVEDTDLVKDLQEVLGILLADNRHAWELRPDGRYVQRRPGRTGGERNAQTTLMKAVMQTAGG